MNHHDLAMDALEAVPASSLHNLVAYAQVHATLAVAHELQGVIEELRRQRVISLEEEPRPGTLR